jgi:hypothetical protein
LEIAIHTYYKYKYSIKEIKNMKDHTNFLLILIIVVIAMFILLCPRKELNYEKREQFNEKIYQEIPEFNPIFTDQEFNKAASIQRMNMEYDTRGDINDLINLNQIPNEGSMFVYP